MATTSDAIRTTRTNVTFRSRAAQIAGYRELLVNLVRKELKVRYKNSVLGFVWSLVNPAVTIAVYYVIFGFVFKSAIPAFAIFLFSGVLVWNMFNTALSATVGSVVGNAPLVKKVWFPREILPLAAVGAAMVDFFLQALVLIAVLVIFRWPVAWSYLPLIPVALVVVVLLSTAIGVWLAAVNVRYRDVQHFLAIALMVWFWGTPIIYSFSAVSKKLAVHGLGNLQLINPMTSIVLAFQRAIYNKGPNGTTHILPVQSFWWYLGLLGAVGGFSIALLLVTARVFRHLEGDFAEAL